MSASPDTLLNKRQEGGRKIAHLLQSYQSRSGQYHDELPPGRTREEVDEAKKNGICLENISIYQIKVLKGVINTGNLTNGYCKIYKSYRDENGEQIRIKLFKTAVQKKTLTPEWDYEGIFSIYDSCQNLRLELWDRSLIKNDYIGCKSIYHKEINQLNKPFETELPLVYKKKINKIVGSVHISLTRLEVNEENKLKCLNGTNAHDRLHLDKLKVPSNFQN